MWGTVAAVSSVIGLIAFAFAATVSVVRTLRLRDERLIRLAKDNQRAKLVERALEFFPVDTEGLSREQKYQLALEQIHARAERFRTAARLAALVAVVSAALLLVALTQRGAGAATLEPAPTDLTVSVTVTVTYQIPEYGWEVAEERKVFTETSPNHDQRGEIRRFFYSYSRQTGPGTRFAEPLGSRGVTDGCRWALGKGPRIVANGQKLLFDTEVWGKPCRWEFWAALETREKVSEATKQEKYEVKYGQNVVIDLPGDVTFWRVQGEAPDGDLIDVVNETSGENFKFVDITREASGVRVTYRLVQPRM